MKPHLNELQFYSSERSLLLSFKNSLKFIFVTSQKYHFQYTKNTLNEVDRNFNLIKILMPFRKKEIASQKNGI